MKILIIGAGVIGASIAFQLARRGHQVTVLDSTGIAAGASGRSFGWINASYALSPAHFRLRLAGMAAHRRLDEALPSSPTRWPGCLWFEEQGEAQRHFAEGLQSQGYKVEHWDQPRIRKTLPHVGETPETALYLPSEGAVDPADLARRLLQDTGAQLWRGVAARDLVEEQGKVIGVQTDQGRVHADHVILAAGTGAPDLLAPLGIKLPMLSRPGLILKTPPLPPLCPWCSGGRGESCAKI